MKKMLFVACLFATLFSYGQDKQNINPGYYVGVIEEGGDKNSYILEFSEDGYAYQISVSKVGDGVDVSRSVNNFKQTSSHNQITTLEWINSGGIWTETQLFICTKISNSRIEVMHIRYVVNEGSEGESWFYGGKSIFEYDSEGVIKGLINNNNN